MKPEPLKGKWKTGKPNVDLTYYYHEDIRSAVEWLKADLGVAGELEDKDVTGHMILDSINEAFEDVMR